MERNKKYDHSDAPSTVVIQEQIIAIEKILCVRFEALENATDKATEALNQRLETMNEFRTQILNERADFVSKVTYDSKHELLEQQIVSLSKLVYMGLGIIAAIEFAFKFFLK
jgi:hypothetical protein